MANEFKVKKGLIVEGSGGTILDIQGSVGQLFSITDSLTGDLFAVSDISGIPILNVNSSGAVNIDGTLTVDGNLNLGDSDKIHLGASQDLQIYHDGSHSYINEAGTGVLTLQTNGTEVQINNGASEYMARFITDGAVNLYYDNSKKFETTNTGVTVTGNITASGNQYFNGEFIEGDGKEIIRYSDAWLRINEDNDFLSGIYCGTGVLRTDGAFQVGSSGGKALITAAGAATFFGAVSASNLSGTNTGDQTLPTLSSLGALSTSGGTMTGTMKVTGSIIHEHNSNSGYIAFPKGGMYQSTANAHTGAIKIKLPTHGGDDMVKFTVDIYDYATDESVTILVSGYIYQASGGNEWTSCTAINLAHQSTKNYTVRFGADGSNSCVWIGETTSTWNHLQVAVTNFWGGFYTDIDAYDDNWEISVVTALGDHVDEVTTNNFPAADYNKIINKPSTFTPPLGSSSTRGGFKIGYSENGKNYPVEVSSEQMYVNVPWADTNTVYTHPTSAGNKHIPTGGAAGQFLKYSSSGTATWATPSYTTNTDTVYVHPTSAGNKHIPTGGAAGQFLKYSSSGTATWATPSYTTNTNTQLSNEAVQDIVGAMFSGNTETNITATYQDGDGTIDLSVAANYGSWNLVDVADSVNRVDSSEHVKFQGANISGTGTQADPFLVATPDTNTTYTADGNYGMTLSGTAFRLENDRRRNSTSTDIYTGNTHDYTFYDASHGIRWYTAGAEEMRLEDDGDLHVDGDVIAFSTTVSDARLKDDVQTIENATDKVNQLRGVSYTWNEGSRKGQREIGVIAQEVEEVVPEVVHEKKLPFVGDETYKTVDYEKLVALLIESNKELTARVEQLEAKLHGSTK